MRRAGLMDQKGYLRVEEDKDKLGQQLNETFQSYILKDIWQYLSKLINQIKLYNSCLI